MKSCSWNAVLEWAPFRPTMAMFSRCIVQKHHLFNLFTHLSHFFLFIKKLVTSVTSKIKNSFRGNRHKPPLFLNRKKKPPILDPSLRAHRNPKTSLPGPLPRLRGPGPRGAGGSGGLTDQQCHRPAVVFFLLFCFGTKEGQNLFLNKATCTILYWLKTLECWLRSLATSQFRSERQALDGHSWNPEMKR